MKLVIFLLSIHTGYNIAKTIDYQSVCNDSQELRLKRSEEKEDSSGKDKKKEFDESATESQIINYTSEKYEYTSDNAKDETINENQGVAVDENVFDPVLQIVPTKDDQNNHTNIEIDDKITNIVKDIPSNQPLLYGTIDPNFIITSKSYPYPTLSNNKSNNNKTDDDVFIDLKKLKSVDNNFIPETNVLSVNNTTMTDAPNLDADVSNIRELREQLLDHLLDYFINIIKEEQNTNSDTQNNNGKDKMTVEEKLRNYYNPEHLDLVLNEDDDVDYQEDDLYFSDYHRDDTDLDLTEHDFGSVNNNYSATHIEPLYTYVLEPANVVSKYINYDENGNVSNDIFLNNAEKSVNTDLNKITTSQDTKITDSEPNTVISKPVNNYYEALANSNEGEYIEYFIYSEEFQETTNLTDKENEKTAPNNTIFTSRSGGKDKVLKEENIPDNISLNDTYNIGNNNSQITTNLMPDFEYENVIDLNNTTTAKLDTLEKNNDSVVVRTLKAYDSNEDINMTLIHTDNKVGDGQNNDIKKEHRFIINNNITLKESNENKCKKHFIFSFNINLI